MKLAVNQNVIVNDNGNLVECYVRRINQKTVTFNQRKPKLENGVIYTYRIRHHQLKKWVQEG
jgi:hypothetical protein